MDTNHYTFVKTTGHLILVAVLLMNIVSSCFVCKLFHAKDSDHDGISDKEDKCPGTPSSTMVDDKGCPLDRDNDGIADYKDDCPDLPGLAILNGCPGSPVFSREMVYLPESTKVSSSECTLDNTIFKDCHAYKDIRQKLVNVLLNVGYPNDFRYFLVLEGGIALATPVDQMNDKGVPLRGANRWASDKKTVFFNQGFDVTELFTRFVKKADGHWRSFLFVVTSKNVSFKPVIEGIGDEVLESYKKDFLGKGMDDIPEIIGNQLLSVDSLKFRIYVYHFKQDEFTKKIELYAKGHDPLTAEEHLKKTKIWEQLRK